MRIIAIDGDRARCEAGGIEREVSLFMLRPDLPVIGDFVLVHVGCAIQTVRPGEARTDPAPDEQAATAHQRASVCNTLRAASHAPGMPANPHTMA